MSKQMHYVLSDHADDDLVNIFDYTHYEFGFNQAVSYLQLFDSTFVALAKTPKLGKSRNEIKKGLYSFPVESHIVFYRIQGATLRIVRVLHQRLDLPKHF